MCANAAILNPDHGFHTSLRLLVLSPVSTSELFELASSTLLFVRDAIFLSTLLPPNTEWPWWKVPLQQSSSHFSVFLVFLRTLLHSKGAPLPLKASLLLSSVQDFPFHSFRQIHSSSISPFRSGLNLSISSFLQCLPQQHLVFPSPLR